MLMSFSIVQSPRRRQGRLPGLLLVVLLLTSGAAGRCYGQYLPIIGLFELANGARTGTPTKFQLGTYQLADGTWQKGKWLIQHDNLLVLDPVNKKKKAEELSTEQLQQFVAGTDTFRVIRNFTIPTSAAPIAAGFGQQLYRGGSFLLARYVYFPEGATFFKSYDVLFHDSEAPGIVPTKQREFREFMLRYVSDHPRLPKQLAGNALATKDAVQILNSYVLWRKFRTPAPQPAPTPAAPDKAAGK